MKKDKDFILNTTKCAIEIEAESLCELATYIDNSFLHSADTAHGDTGFIHIHDIIKESIG